MKLKVIFQIKRIGPIGLIGLILSLTQSAAFGLEKKTELLWPEGAPGAVGEEDLDKPSLTICLPDPASANGIGVVVCPGGGYAMLAMDHEGEQIADWLNAHGIAAFVLKYRLGPRYHHPAPLQDAQRAIRIVRSRAQEFGVDPARIGILGFSAGGHLASTAGTHFDSGDPASQDPIEKQSCRPDFMILVYPVLTMTDPHTHQGSRKNLLGENPSPDLIELLSNEKQVTPETPPAFLVHGHDDGPVPVQNSLQFYAALKEAGVVGELHVYERGKHGFGLGTVDPIVSGWPDLCVRWIRNRGE
jgi:acetyl esterase/lipase